jgi:hypothetical protein
VAAQLDVVEHGHAAEQGHVLEDARQAQGGALVRTLRRDVGALEQNESLLRPVEVGDGVEQAGLAGTVGTDDRGDLARRARSET